MYRSPLAFLTVRMHSVPMELYSSMSTFLRNGEKRFLRFADEIFWLFLIDGNLIKLFGKQCIPLVWLYVYFDHKTDYE